MPWHADMPEEYKNQIITGDAGLLAEHIPPESVDLVLCDPVYWQIADYVWLLHLAGKVLKNNKACLMWQGQQWLGDTIVALADCPLRYRWILGWYANNNMQMVGKIGRKIAPLLWYEKGHSNPIKAIREVKESPIPNGNTPFKWAKRLDVVAYYLERFTEPNDVVLDCFSGGGSTAAACKMLGRNYVSFEIDPNTAEKARQRVDSTQPIMDGFNEAYTQAEMEL